MRTLTALVFNYSLDGYLADPDTDFWKFCFGLLDDQGGPDDDEQTLDLLDSAYAHVMGRVAYEGMSKAMPAATDNPWSDILNRGRKVVFSRTLQAPGWANTRSLPATRPTRSTGSGGAATATSSSGAASASGAR